MEFSQDTVKKIRGLIVFAVLVTVAGVNYRGIMSLAAWFIGILYPFLLGGAIAFVFHVPMRWIESMILPGRECRWKRPVSLFLAVALVTGVVVVVMIVVVPELFRTLTGLQSSIPLFLSNLQKQLEQWFARYPDMVAWIGSFELNSEQLIQDLVSFLSRGAGSLLSTTFLAAQSIASGVATFSIGFIFSIYLLLQKETLGRQAEKVLRAFLPSRTAEWLLRVASLTERVFSSFLAGQCLEAVILGAMFFVVLSLLGMPYAVLIGVLIGFTALIPVFGAFIGCAVGAFLILMSSPLQALSFIVIFFVLQQVEGNLIYPHVVGNSVGLPSIWVLAAVTLGGSMMGIAGMLVFIPLTSVCYTLLREEVNRRVSGACGNRGTDSGKTEKTCRDGHEKRRGL